MLTNSRRPARRRGTFVPILALCCTALFMFVALAVDLGMLTVARTQCQNAADSAALTGCRNLNNKTVASTSYNNNSTAAVDAARDVVTKNYLMNGQFTAATNLQNLQLGVYAYDTGTQTFNVLTGSTARSANMASSASGSAVGAAPTGNSWTAVEVVTQTTQPTFFAKVFGINSMQTEAKAVAVHRPRDIAFALDFTGSMGESSILAWSKGLHSADPTYPQFGHYTRFTTYTTNSTSASETATTASSRPNPFVITVEATGQGIANLTAATANGDPIIKDFYYDGGNLSNPATAIGEDALNTTTTTTNGITSVAPNLWNAFHATTFSATSRTATTGPTPAPAGFDTQGTTSYVGDRWPRKKGKVYTSAVTWSPTSTATGAEGAAVTAAELLGWANPSSYGSGWQGTVPSRSGLAHYSGLSYANTTSSNGTVTIKAAWSDFRDATWERYGYDLDVAHYVANRGTTWDPRWDWDIDAGQWKHTGTAPGSGVTFRPQRKAAADRHQGFSMGPGYWGKTFFVWPPDPRKPVGDPGDTGYVPGDWRRRFFLRLDGTEFVVNPTLNGTAAAEWPTGTLIDNDSRTTGNTWTSLRRMDANTSTTATQDTSTTSSNATNFETINETLFNTGTSGYTLRSPSSRYQINYPAVLKWIKSGPMVLPPNLRSGRLVYYSSIPDDVATVTGDSADVLADKAFWREYIKYVFAAAVTGPPGRDEKMGWPDGTSANFRTFWLNQFDPDGATTTLGGDPRPYMAYTDHVIRPRMTFWFGPLTMLTFIGEKFGNWPGASHEAQCWQLKAGVNSVLDDIKNNHPNDRVGLAFFANTGTERYTDVVVRTGDDWAALKAALFFPKSLLPAISAAGKSTATTTQKTTAAKAEIRPYTYTGSSVSWLASSRPDVPYADGNTDPVTGMALAYNLLSATDKTAANTGFTVPTTDRGRRGASKIVILETDGQPNATMSFTFKPKGYESYYQYNSGGYANPGASLTNSSVTNTIAVIDQIRKDVATDNNANTDSGLSLPNTKALVYAIGFGDLFEAGGGADARTFLLYVQQAGGTSKKNTAATGQPSNADTAIPSDQIITGDYATRIDNLKLALQKIMQGGIQVTLIE